jgi:hypothetical protein
VWNKIKLFLGKLKRFVIYFVQIMLVIFFGLFLIVSNQKANEKNSQDTQAPPKLSQNFVSIEKDDSLELYLDLENGCKYYKDFGIKYKRDGKTIDCDLKYVDNYKKKKKETK